MREIPDSRPLAQDEKALLVALFEETDGGLHGRCSEGRLIRHFPTHFRGFAKKAFRRLARHPERYVTRHPGREMTYSLTKSGIHKLRELGLIL